MGWSHIGSAVTAAFLASIVEFVEALTVILAVGSVRGWRWALAGAAAAILVLLALVAVLGPALALMPVKLLQVAIGTLLLLFGMRWLRKAILRSAGVIALNDEAAAFAKHADAMRQAGAATGFDSIGFAATFQITMLEGVEVVFIVIAVGAGGVGLMLPAALAALAALVVVIALGLVVHRPLARVPENTLKFVVGILLTAFGSFWLGEGFGVAWPGDDWSVLGLLLGFAATALALVPLCRRSAARKAQPA